jgi:class 3 adenylate cyclase
MAPTTRYARNGDVHIAYQVVGQGPIDLLYVPQSSSAVEQLWEEPRVARWFERLASFSRLILFDRRESGASDRLGRPPTLEEQMDDVIAVLDAAGATRVGVTAIYEGGPMAMLFAATHPERTGALALYATFARTTRAEGYEWAPTAAERLERHTVMYHRWGDGSMVDAFAPGHAHDERLRGWIGRLQRSAMSPGAAIASTHLNQDLDVRDVLPSIRVPTLVLHRTADPAIDVRHSRFIAGQIPGARLVELSGPESFPFVGDTESVIGELEEFFTGARHASEPDRVLATVLFSDICGSTEIAARLGDRSWRAMLADHHDAARQIVTAYRGRSVKTMGDGILATFDGPARAIRAARALAGDGPRLGLELRVGLHTGEVEVIGDDIGGMAVHIAARVMGHAGPGEVVTSGTVHDLVAGSGLEFEDRGTHELRGVPDEWRLWSVAVA